jgi:hypothetical protein
VDCVRQRASQTDFGENDRATHRWVREQGLDVLDVIEKGQGAVLGFDMAVLPVKDARWETATPSEVLTNAMLGQMEPNKITAVSPATDKTSTFLIRTREGGLGLMRFADFIENPPSVTIRYKLVRGGKSPGRASKGPGPASIASGQAGHRRKQS